MLKRDMGPTVNIVISNPQVLQALLFYHRDLYALLLLKRNMVLPRFRQILAQTQANSQHTVRLMQRSLIQKVAKKAYYLGHVTFADRPLYFHGYGQGWR